MTSPKGSRAFYKVWFPRAAQQGHPRACFKMQGPRPRPDLNQTRGAGPSHVCVTAPSPGGLWHRRTPRSHCAPRFRGAGSRPPPYPMPGCSTMARGSSRSSDTRILREVPLRRATSMRSVPVSVQ